ncbi:MAG: S-layer homology domain-containing protein [Bacillota bacterium]|jgi:hypothetical protein
MRKIMIVFLSLVMVLAMAVPALAYTDTAGCSNAQKDAIANLTSLKIVEGYADGTFQPQGSVTRAEFAKIAVNSYIEFTGSAAFTQMYFDFPDVVEGAWYDTWIQNACNGGMLKGYEDGTFRPNAVITGNEAVTVLVRMMGYSDEDLEGSWPKNYLDKAKELGILANANVDYSKAVSRADVCVLTDNVLNYETTAANYAMVEKIDKDTVTLLSLDGSSKTYELAAANGAEANDLVLFSSDSRNRATLSVKDIYTNNTDLATVDGTDISLNGKTYKLTADTKVYLIDGKNGDLTSSKVAAGTVQRQSFVKAAQTSKINVDIQYTLKNGSVDTLIIGGYSGSGLQFGFIEEMGISSAKFDCGVQMFGEETIYEKSDNSDETLSLNTLYQYKVRNNEITLNRVDRAKEQIQKGSVDSFGDDLYNVTDDNGTEKQFVVTKDTVVIKAVYDKDGDLDSVDYDYQIKKGDVVDVRYNVKAEADKEAAYVIVIKNK